MMTLRKSKRAIDTGRSLGRIKGEGVSYEIEANVLPWYDTQGGNPLVSPDDIIIEESNGDKWFVGQICKRVASGSNGQSLKEAKDTHENYIINMALLAKTETIRTDLLINIPFGHMNEDGENGARYIEEKKNIKSKMKGEHTFKIHTGNGRGQLPKIEEHTITIDRLGFAAETEIIFFSEPTHDEEVGILELGSRTVQLVYYMDGMVAPGKSASAEWGYDTVKVNKDKKPQQIAEMLHRMMQENNWDTDLPVRIAGGAAEVLEEHIRAVYPNASAVPNPRYANLNAMWLIMNQ